MVQRSGRRRRALRWWSGRPAPGRPPPSPPPRGSGPRRAGRSPAPPSPRSPPAASSTPPASPSTSLTRLLNAARRADPATRRPAGLTPGGVLVVDEASMVDTRTLAHLLAHTRAAGGTLVLVGDPAQLPEVGAGGLFTALARHPDTITLTDNRRQTEAWERRALADLRAGDPDAAVAAYADHGRVHTAPADQLARPGRATTTSATSRPGDVEAARREVAGGPAAGGDARRPPPRRRRPQRHRPGTAPRRRPASARTRSPPAVAAPRGSTGPVTRCWSPPTTTTSGSSTAPAATVTAVDPRRRTLTLAAEDDQSRRRRRRLGRDATSTTATR